MHFTHPSSCCGCLLTAGSDVYNPVTNTVTQVPVNTALWRASYYHYYAGDC